MGIVCVRAFWRVWLTRTCCSAARSLHQEGLVQAAVDMAVETMGAFSSPAPSRPRERPAASSDVVLRDGRRRCEGAAAKRTPNQIHHTAAPI